MKLKKLVLENFKGVRHAEYDFADKTKIKGMNGAGKSTIFSAYLWLWVDKDSLLVSNPQVRPNDAIDEQIVSVTADVMFGDKPVQIQKSQKLKRSKNGTVALTNSYMVNSVPKSEKDFKAYLTELGVDFDKFLLCSHPNVMLAGINNKKERTALRNMLFEMAEKFTDLDIARSDEELAEIARLLVDYEAEEIEAMQNATLRKIRENYGKEGEILRAKIEGLESAKENIDLDFHKSKVDEIHADIDVIKKKIETRQEQLKKATDASAEIMQKKFLLTDIENKANAERLEKKKNAETTVFKLEMQKENLQQRIQSAKAQIQSVESDIKKVQERQREIQEKLRQCHEYKFDDKNVICPTCGQALPKRKVKEIKAQNELKVEYAKQRHEESLRKAKEAIDDGKLKIHATEATIRRAEDSIEEINRKLSRAREIVMDAENIPKANMAENAEYQHVMAEISKLKNVADKEQDIRAEIRQLESRIEGLQTEKDAHLLEIAKDSQNKRIDGQIEKLRDDQRNYEQSKADAEMILHQLKALNMKKNELLQESVNSRFSLVEWRLWDVLKNGEYRDACIPMIDGKAFGESMNTALEIMAKIDAMNGIQKFFRFDYPIILDDAEHLDSESMKKIETDHQLIMLCVSDDPELVFDREVEE